jgi:hypothetical protein
VGYQNPPIRWSELEHQLSDQSRPGSHGSRPLEADGGDSPAWSQHRGPYVPPENDRPRRPAGPVTPYAELHVHSNFSFLDGTSSAEHLVEESVRLGLHALALTDHDGSYGQRGSPRPDGRCGLRRDPAGRRRLARGAALPCRNHPAGRSPARMARRPDRWAAPARAARAGQGEAVVAALGGVDVDIVMPVVAAVDAYVIGAVRREIAERRAERATGMDKQQWQAAFGPYLERTFATGRFPRWPRSYATAPTRTPTKPSGPASPSSSTASRPTCGDRRRRGAYGVEETAVEVGSRQ